MKSKVRASRDFVDQTEIWIYKAQNKVSRSTSSISFGDANISTTIKL